MEETKNFESSESLELVYKGANGQVLTTSLMVAKKFEKDHSDVLKAIRNIFKAGEKSLDVENQQFTKIKE